MKYKFSDLMGIEYNYKDLLPTNTKDFKSNFNTITNIKLSENEKENKKYSPEIINKVLKKFELPVYSKNSEKIINFIESFNGRSKNKINTEYLSNILCFFDDSQNQNGRTGVLITIDKIYFNLMRGCDVVFLNDFDVIEDGLFLNNKSFKFDHFLQHNSTLKNIIQELLILKKLGKQINYAHPILKEKTELRKKYLKILTFLILDDSDKKIYANDVLKLEEYFLSFGLKVKDFEEFIENNKKIKPDKIFDEIELKLLDYKYCIIYDTITMSLLDGELQKSEELFIKKIAQKLQIDMTVISKYFEISKTVSITSKNLKNSYKEITKITKDKLIYELVNFNLISDINDLYTFNEEQKNTKENINIEEMTNNIISEINKGIYLNFSNVKDFLLKGADINIKNKEGYSLLSTVIEYKKGLESVEYLVKNGADVNIVDTKGKTPIFYAVLIDDNLKIIECLIKNGANLKHKTLRDKSVLDFALDEYKSYLNKFIK